MVRLLLFVVMLFAAVAQAATSVESPLLMLQKGDHYIGRRDARVVFIEYSSVSCPHCAEFHQKTFKEFKRRYIDTGKVLYIYRDLPTNRPGLLGAILSHCAGDAEYLNYIDTLMTSQHMWAYRKDYEAALINIGNLGGVGEKKLKQCFSDKALEERILQSSMEASRSLDITATPTFFINGEKYNGHIAENMLFKLIEEKLN